MRAHSLSPRGVVLKHVSDRRCIGMSILVRHAMTGSPQTISRDMNAADAAGLMRSEDVGVLPVMDGGKLCGLVTDRDLVLRVLAARKDPLEVKVGDICTSSPVTVTPDTKLAEARDLMAEHKVRRLPVIKGQELVGILSLGDVAWQDASTREVGSALRSVSESESTREANDTAARGTPKRVQDRRESA
jgi:CBS domain-containing protein